MILILFILMLISPAVFGQETKQIWDNNSYSVGVNGMILRDPTIITLKKWSSNNKGHELIISNTAGFIGSKNLQLNGVDSESLVQGTLPSVEYLWIKRNVGLLKSDEAYMYTGIGLNLSASFLETDTNGSRTGAISANLRFPVGIEHFFLKSVPFLSYSIEADFYAGCTQNYYESTATTNKVTTVTKNTTNLLDFGMTPRFMVNYYFK